MKITHMLTAALGLALFCGSWVSAAAQIKPEQMPLHSFELKSADQAKKLHEFLTGHVGQYVKLKLTYREGRQMTIDNEGHEVDFSCECDDTYEGNSYASFGKGGMFYVRSWQAYPEMARGEGGIGVWLGERSGQGTCGKEVDSCRIDLLYQMVFPDKPDDLMLFDWTRTEYLPGADQSQEPEYSEDYTNMGIKGVFFVAKGTWRKTRGAPYLPADYCDLHNEEGYCHQLGDIFILKAATVMDVADGK